MVDESTFAIRSLHAYQLYHELSLRERVPRFRAVLEELAHTSKDQFDYWARKSGVRGDAMHLRRWEVFLYRVMRAIFGVRVVAKFILGHKERTVAEYMKFCRTCTVADDAQIIDAFVERLHAVTDSLHHF